MADVQKGELYYVPASVLGLPSVSPSQEYKVQIHQVMSDGNVLLLVKHFETKECNKVTVKVALTAIQTYGFKVSI